MSQLSINDMNCPIQSSMLLFAEVFMPFPLFKFRFFAHNVFILLFLFFQLPTIRDRPTPSEEQPYKVRPGKVQPRVPRVPGLGPRPAAAWYFVFI